MISLAVCFPPRQSDNQIGGRDRREIRNRGEGKNFGKWRLMESALETSGIYNRSCNFPLGRFLKGANSSLAIYIKFHPHLE